MEKLSTRPQSLLSTSIDKELQKLGFSRDNVLGDPSDIQHATYFKLKDKWVEEKSDIILRGLRESNISKIKMAFLLAFWLIDEKINERKIPDLRSVRCKALEMALSKLSKNLPDQPHNLSNKV